MGQKIAHNNNLAVIKNLVLKIDVELSKLWFGHTYSERLSGLVKNINTLKNVN